MSKSRYRSIESAVTTSVNDTAVAAAIMQSIREVMKFDPERTTYDASHARCVRDWRQRKCQETGLSFYELSGKKEKRAAAKTVK